MSSRLIVQRGMPLQRLVVRIALGDHILAAPPGHQHQALFDDQRLAAKRPLLRVDAAYHILGDLVRRGLRDRVTASISPGQSDRKHSPYLRGQRHSGDDDVPPALVCGLLDSMREPARQVDDGLTVCRVHGFDE
jgi:hypothetical protein